MDPVSLVPILTPHGHLSLVHEDDAQALDSGLARRLRDAFTRGSGHGLLQQGTDADPAPAKPKRTAAAKKKVGRKKKRTVGKTARAKTSALTV